MSFDLKLFQFQSQKPFRTTYNEAQFFKIFPKNDPNRLYTLKVYNICDDRQMEQYENEVKIHLIASALQPNVMQIKGSCLIQTKDNFGFENRKYCILMEDFTASLSQLKSQLQATRKRLDTEQLTNFLKVCITVLACLEKNNIVHRNLSLDSIF